MEQKNIRTVEVTDLSECIHVLSQFKNYDFLKKLQDEDFLKDYAKRLLDNGHIVVEYHNDIPVGLLCFYCNNIDTKTGFVTALVISEDLGFMKGKTLFRLISTAVKIGKNAGMESVQLEVKKNNKTAIRLYEHFGFNYIPSEKEDFYLMELELSKLMSSF